MAAETAELDRLLADIARNITENRRFIQNLLDEGSTDEPLESDEEAEETFEEL